MSYFRSRPCVDPEGGVSIIGFFRNKQLNPSLEKAGPLKIVGPPEKCWGPLEPWKIIVFFEIRPLDPFVK